MISSIIVLIFEIWFNLIFLKKEFTVPRGKTPGIARTNPSDTSQNVTVMAGLPVIFPGVI
jgi:hypothetical protein